MSSPFWPLWTKSRSREFDEAAYLTDPNHEIYSRYVMTAADTPTAARLDAEGWQAIYQSEKCMIYMRTM